MGLSERISADDIKQGRCFELRWLKQQEPMRLFHRLKLGTGPRTAKFLDAITTAETDFQQLQFIRMERRSAGH